MFVKGKMRLREKNKQYSAKKREKQEKTWGQDTIALHGNGLLLCTKRKGWLPFWE